MMKGPARALAALALSLVPASASAAAPAASPAARIDAALIGIPGFEGMAAPERAAVPEPSAPAAAAVSFPADSIVPVGLWASLAAPDAATQSWLSARVPGLDAGAVRVLTAAAAEPLFDAAIARGESPLDFFTDPGFRGREVYYLPQAEVAALFARYDMRVLTPPSGTATNGTPFAMKALVFGAGRIDAIYGDDGFKFKHPDFGGEEVSLAGQVTERIQGPGDLAIEGVSVKHGIFHPVIKRIVKTSPTEGRVETNLGSRTKPSNPIRRR